MIIRKVSGTPINLKDLIKDWNGVVKIISIANETELSTLRKRRATTWMPLSVIPICSGML